MIRSTVAIKEHESERRKKALLYTLGICGALLLMFFLISWKNVPPPPPPPEQLIEVNLGNNEEGFGEEQPLVKGEGGPVENLPDPSPAASAPEVTDNVTPDDNAEKDAAPVTKSIKIPSKIKTPVPVTATVPKPAKPKITMPGTSNKNNGNNADEDNGYKYQGNKPGKPGDAGIPTGDKDSYGNTPGGAKGGRKVIKNVTTVRYYSFTGDLPKATIYAIVRISATGRGTFIAFDKGSTTRDPRYATDIKTKLLNIQFQKPDYESTVTVQFNFKES